MSFVARQAFSVVRIQIHLENSGNLRIFFRHFMFICTDTDCFQVCQVPLVLLRPPKGSVRPQNLPKRDVNTQTSPLCLIDFVQDLYLREVKAYKPAPKVSYVQHASSRILDLKKLIQNSLLCYLGC